MTGVKLLILFSECKGAPVIGGLSNHINFTLKYYYLVLSGGFQISRLFRNFKNIKNFK